MENGIQYEIINKVTGVAYLATSIEFGTGVVIVNTNEVGAVTFANDGNGGWTHSEYVARDAETRLAPNGVDTVEDIVPSVPESVPEAATEVAPEATPESTEVAG